MCICMCICMCIGIPVGTCIGMRADICMKVGVDMITDMYTCGENRQPDSQTNSRDDEHKLDAVDVLADRRRQRVASHERSGARENLVPALRFQLVTNAVAASSVGTRCHHFFRQGHGHADPSVEI